MEKILVLLAVVLSLAAIYFLGSTLLGRFVGFGEPQTSFGWWNISWHYRFMVEVNSTAYDREEWPVELNVNFTDLLPTGTFDINSIRIFEYNQNGQILYEVPSQFEPEDDFDASTNAVGTIVFMLNGTTDANAKRIFFVYYDTVENGAKEQPNYPSNIQYSWDGRLIEVNTSFLKIRIDTNRSESTSGMYYVSHPEVGGETLVFSVGGNERTAEYLEYFNGTHNTTFYLAGNASFQNGPVRLVVKQMGDEIIFGNPEQKTNELQLIKKYYIYYRAGSQSDGSFIKIKQKLINKANYNVERNSTPAGALAFDLERAFYMGIYAQDFDDEDPYSWVFASSVGGQTVGIINLEESTEEFFSNYSQAYGRIGIQLNSVTLAPGETMQEKALVYLGAYSESADEFLRIKNRYKTPLQVEQKLPEVWYVHIEPYTNATIYNRGEALLIKGNVSSGDPYSLVKYMNVTIDMGTPSTSDDQTLILYDDGTHGDEVAGDKSFANIFEIPTDAATGIWKLNFTAYSEDLDFLNFTEYMFDVTDKLNVTLSIVNEKPMVGTIVLAYIDVKNYRQDQWITGAAISCKYDSSEVENKTDMGNGTYAINFTAPSTEGVYTLTCNASKSGNEGNDSKIFEAEPAKTYVEIVPIPENPQVYAVSLYKNDSFMLDGNATNFGNGTAYSLNISVELPSGWDADYILQECFDLNKHSYCAKAFNVTVPNGTAPGNYTINLTVEWKNPDSSLGTNRTSLNVTVRSNPMIEVVEESISSEVSDGVWNWVGNFTVLSVGNDQLQGIAFSCANGYVCNNFDVAFIPESISTLSVGSQESILVNVSVPFAHTPGLYTGTINVTSQNNGFDTLLLSLTIPTKTNISITTNLPFYTVYGITQKDNKTFNFSAYATNIGNGSAKNVNISLSIPSGWSANSTLEECGNLLKSVTCTKAFNITVPEKTVPGNYFIYVNTNWTQPDSSMGTNTTTITVTVASNPKLEVEEESLEGSMNASEEKHIGNFTILSVGNDQLQGITFSCVSGEVCQNFSLEFDPPFILSLAAGASTSVALNVSVPERHPTGTYTGTINVTSQNNGFDTFTLQVTVAENRTWDLKPTVCERSTQQPEGIACEINVTNLGNTYINFTVYPEKGNYTEVNETEFSVMRLGWHVFSIKYNVTGAPAGIYNSTFTVDAVEADANPDKKDVKVSLLPYIPPIINATVVPNETEQKGNVTIFANVTDMSGTGMAVVTANITIPNGTVYSMSMFLIEAIGDFSRWELTYPNVTGDTDLSGRYNVTIYARDNIGNEETYNTSFKVYTKFETFLSTLSDKYYQGDAGSIFYKAYSFGLPVADVSVNFTIINPQGNTIYISPTFTTNSEGTLVPMPSFTIASDALLGNYTLTAISSYFDENSGKTIVEEKNYTFQVFSRTVTVTGLFADIETAVVWYPENIMKFGILVYNGEGKPVDPTNMSLTVYDPANNIYLLANLSQMTRHATGYYIYQYAMPITTPSGMFLAVLNVTQESFNTMKLKAFRVAHGGPYDVRINLLEYEVEQGSYLDFILIIENKGEVSQDVFVQYWISSEGNLTYFSTSEAVLTPALTNQSFTRTAYIYSNQPLGSYYLNVRVTYDTVQPPILANASFVVVAKVSPPTQNVTYTYPVYVPTGAVPMPAPTEKILANIQISKYKSNISVARGYTAIEAVTVSNVGETALENVNLVVMGIPVSWFTVTPESYANIEKDGSRVFLVTFSIPKNAKIGEYEINLVATSGVVSDRKIAKLIVYESMEELLKQEIKRLKEDLLNLEVDTRVAEIEGKDVTTVRLMIDEIKRKISDAENYLDAGKLEDALDSITTGRNLLDRAREILASLKVVRVGFVMPLWLIALIAVAVCVSIVFVVLLLRRRKVSIRPWIVHLGKIADMVRKKKVVEKESLIKEKEKLLRMLEVIEKQKRENVISLSAYNSMKKNIESKLREIEKKIV